MRFRVVAWCVVSALTLTLLPAMAEDLPWKDITGTNRAPDSVRSAVCSTPVVAGGTMQAESEGANLDTTLRGLFLIVR